MNVDLVWIYVVKAGFLFPAGARVFLLHHYVQACFGWCTNCAEVSNYITQRRTARLLTNVKLEGIWNVVILDQQRYGHSICLQWLRKIKTNVMVAHIPSEIQTDHLLGKGSYRQIIQESIKYRCCLTVKQINDINFIPPVETCLDPCLKSLRTFLC